MSEGYEPQPYSSEIIDKSSSITVNTTFLHKGTDLYCYVIGRLAVCSINFGVKQAIAVNTQVMSGFPKPIKQYVFSTASGSNFSARLKISTNGEIYLDDSIASSAVNYWYDGCLVYPIA